jgi:membrane fusion protein, multidrug efflux system
MEMEAPEIEQNSIAAQARYLKSVATLKASKDSYVRLLNASQTAGAVSPNDLQSALSKMQSDSALCNSEKANWKSVDILRNYLTVRAPFEGTITQRNIDPGALVNGGNRSDSKPLLELKQISKLRLQVRVPEAFASQLSPNQKIDFTTESLHGKTFQGVVTRQANSLDEKYRSETIELDVTNKDNSLIPGMYVEVLLPITGHQNTCIVPQTAVITSTERKYIIKVVHHKAVMVDVNTGNENDGMVEVFGNVVAGDQIISKADEEIKPNQVVE